MSRIPQPPSSSRNTSRTPSKPPSTPSARAGSSSRKPPPSPTPGSRALRPQPSLKSVKPPPATLKSPGARAIKPTDDELSASAKAQSVSIREQIALKRAEAKKAMSKTPAASPLDDFVGLEDALPTRSKTPDDGMIDLGRWSVKETIERGRTTGAINLASRSLPCLPSALFEIHLGITPEPLKSVPIEPPLTTTSSDETSLSRRRTASQTAPSWYEAQDLGVLKAWSNEILEIQPEISMFGSLKSIDLHNNKLHTLPESFGDLTALTSLDLSHNEIDRLPSNIWALPNLAALNLSHNALTALPFFSPFAAAGANPLARTRDPRGDWYSQSITRAMSPLPKLLALDVSHNQLSASSIDHEPEHIPASISKLNLSSNPLGLATSLIRALSRLENLSEIIAEHADIGDASFPVHVLSEAYTPFPALTLLDLGETHVTRPAMEAAFLASTLKRTIEFEVTPEPPKPGTIRVVVGKRVVKEAWEIEAERRAKPRGRHLSHAELAAPPATPEAVKEAWEVDAENGLFSAGARRRARATSSTAASSIPQQQLRPTSPVKPPAAVVEKEQWEIEAEQGLLTAGGRRRARAAATTSALSVSASHSPSPSSTPTTSPTPSASALANPQYYSAATQTLTLPPSTALTKAAHMRSFSLAAKIAPSTSSSASDLALAIPTPTLPLAAIVAQPFSHTLRCLVLTGRRMDVAFALPVPAEIDGPFLPALEELVLENCNLSDLVPVSREPSGSSRTSESLLPLLARLFPSLRTLDLSYNALTSASLTQDALAGLILAGRGLRQLRLRGNRLTELDGFQGVAESFRGNREVPGWRLEELDLRDNEIGRLPPEVGLLPLEVFLVDGNVFRVPARRVWEREGTKGLLSWLRGRIE